jgi:hypothetical protein
MKRVIFLIVTLAFACSESEDPTPAAKSFQFTDANTVAKHWIKPGEFHLYLFGLDTMTFINIIPNPNRIGVFDYNDIEGTPGKFMNSSCFEDGQHDQLLSAGRLEIKTFNDDFIDFTFDVTYRSGKHVQGSYQGEVSKLK